MADERVIWHAPAPRSRRSAQLRLGTRDDEILLFLYLAGYARTDQIAQACFGTVAERSRLRAAQRRLKQLSDARFLRAVEAAAYPRRREGAPSLIYTLAGQGGGRVAERLGLQRREIEVRPKPREGNISWLGHTLDLVDYWLSLRRACRAGGVALESWVTDRQLQKRPAKVAVTGGPGAGATVGVVPDACYVLARGHHTAACLLEYDRATVTLQPASWTRKGWRRKVEALLALAEEGRLREHYGAATLWVKVVTKSRARLDNMCRVTEKTARERAHHFWFTTEETLQKNILTDPIWRVAGRPGVHAAVP